MVQLGPCTYTLHVCAVRSLQRIRDLCQANCSRLARPYPKFSNVDRPSTALLIHRSVRVEPLQLEAQVNSPGASDPPSSACLRASFAWASRSLYLVFPGWENVFVALCCPQPNLFRASFFVGVV